MPSRTPRGRPGRLGQVLGAVSGTGVDPTTRTTEEGTAQGADGPGVATSGTQATTTAPADTWVERLPAALAAFGSVVAVGGTQGGYFPNMWGPSAAVLLAHQPVVIHDAVEHGVDLQLSGHTHGGQLWPGNLLAELANPTVAGLERYGDTQLFVSRGAGAWGPPVRVGAPSDITVVELASRQA